MGGLIGYIYDSIQIYNSYNIGEIVGDTNIGGIAGGALWNNPNNLFDTVFFLDNTNKGFGKFDIACGTKYTKEEFMNTDINNILNLYIKNNGIETKDWCKWIEGADGYPTLDCNTVWNETDWAKNN